MKSLHYFSLGLITVAAMACTDKGKLPTVVTGTYTTYPSTKTVQCEGFVETDGGEVVVERGICYVAGSATPKVSDSRVGAGSGKGSFSAVLQNIEAGTYTYRAYATNSAGTAYGSAATFTMDSSGGSGGGGGGTTQNNSLKAGDKEWLISNVKFEIVDLYAIHPSYRCDCWLSFYENSSRLFVVTGGSLSSYDAPPTGVWQYSTTYTSGFWYDDWMCERSIGTNHYSQPVLELVKVARSGNNYIFDITINSTASLHYEGPISISRRTENAN